MTPVRRYHVRVSGRVQGVFFRRFAVEQARALGLAGAVWNRPDGRVELVAEGPEARLDQLVERLRQGPPAASVEGVEVRRGEPSGDFAGFAVEYR